MHWINQSINQSVTYVAKNI